MMLPFTLRKWFELQEGGYIHVDIHTSLCIAIGAQAHSPPLYEYEV